MQLKVSGKEEEDNLMCLTSEEVVHGLRECMHQDASVITSVSIILLTTRATRMRR